MLLLVDADGDELGLIEQDIRHHEGRVGEEAGVDVVGVLRALVLELGHAGELAEHGVAVDDPAELGVRGDVTLHEEGVLFGIEAAGDVEGEGLVGAAAQIGRDLAHGDRVLVDDAVIAVIRVGEVGEIADRAEVVSDREDARGLHAGENDFLVFVHDADFL